MASWETASKEILPWIVFLIRAMADAGSKVLQCVIRCKTKNEDNSPHCCSALGTLYPCPAILLFFLLSIFGSCHKFLIHIM